MKTSKKTMLAIAVTLLLAAALFVGAGAAEEYVAKVVPAGGGEGTSFTTLLGAVNAATTPGDTIVMLANYDNPDHTIGHTTEFHLSAGVTLDGNDHSIKGNSSVYFDAAGGKIVNVTFESITDGTVSTVYPKHGLTPVYGKDLYGTAEITGCIFDTCDWDAIQITPVDNAKIVITNNEFKNGVTKRYVHIQSTGKKDFSATVTGNKFIFSTAMSDTALEIYSPSDLSKIYVDGNYFKEPAMACLLTMDSTGYVSISEVLRSIYKDDAFTEKVNVIATVSDGSAGANEYICTSAAEVKTAAEEVEGDSVYVIILDKSQEDAIRGAVTEAEKTGTYSLHTIASGSSIVSYNSGFEYTVVIPALFDFKSNLILEGTVAVNVLFADDTQDVKMTVTAKPTDGRKLTLVGGSETIGYEIRKDTATGTEINEEVRTFAGSDPGVTEQLLYFKLAGKPTKAGTYTDTLTFTTEVVEAA